MCIEFVYINNNPHKDGYKLIVTNNRDEHYDRPTQPATFWGTGENYLSGLDKFPGRQGGTWFGVARNGKVGALLNVLTPQGPQPDKRPRGHLVTDYLSRPVNAAAYIQELQPDGPSFNQFNLVLIERSGEGNGQFTAHYYSNSQQFGTSPVTILTDGIHGFGNSVYTRPFQKVCKGKATMSEVITKFGSVGQRENLHQALFDLMADKTPTIPDPQLALQGGEPLRGELGEQRSGIYVDSSQIGYGTRTTTLFTVTADDRAEYIEKTMREPIDKLNPVWDTVSYSFSLLPPKSQL